MKRFSILIITILTLVNVSFAQMKNQLQASSVSHEKQKQAEQIVIRAIGRFGQTLDFGNVYRETFVRNKIVRRREDTPLLEGFIDKKLLRKTDDATFEQAFIKSQNLYWLFMAYSLRKNGDEIERIERGISPLLSKNQRVIYERILSEREDITVKSPTEIADCLAVYEKMSAALSQEIEPEIKQQLQHKITARASRFSSDAAGENTLKVSVQIDGDSFPFAFVTAEESGKTKILSVLIQ